jgi:hypothetical protein
MPRITEGLSPVLLCHGHATAAAHRQPLIGAYFSALRRKGVCCRMQLCTHALPLRAAC